MLALVDMHSPAKTSGTPYVCAGHAEMLLGMVDQPNAVLSWDNGTVSVLKRDKAGRTAGTADTCEFYQQGHRCREPGAGELRGHYMDSHGGFPWTLCAEHVKPGHHPADLRDKLVTW